MNPFQQIIFAARERQITLPYSSKAKAVSARNKLYAERRKLLKTDEHLYSLAREVTITTSEDPNSPGQWIVLLEPTGYDMLKLAGIEPESVFVPEQTEQTPTSEASPGSFTDEMLEEAMRKAAAGDKKDTDQFR